MRLFVKVLLPLVAFFPSIAPAATVVGGDTRVSFSSAISGLSAGLTGNASLVGGLPGLTLNFPITGGALDVGLAGNIRHDGSGLTLSNGTNTLGLSNFVIDTTASTLFGDVALNGVTAVTALELFTFDLSSVTVAQLTDLTNPTLSLFISSPVASALSTTFGLPDTTGLSIGFAATAPQLAAIPEPETWLMFIGGFGIAGVMIRRSRRTTAHATA